MSTLRGILWNVRKNTAQAVGALSSYLEKMEVDVLFIVEDGGVPLDESSNSWDLIIDPKKFDGNFDGNNKLSVYRKVNSYNLKEGMLHRKVVKPFHNRAGFRVLCLTYGTEYLIFLVHLPSQLNDLETNFAYAIELNREIRLLEIDFFKKRPPRTIVMGDFNANVYDPLMIHPLSFNAPYAKGTFYNGDEVDSYTKVGGRLLRRDLHYPAFYNKMWSLLGVANDDINQPQGTRNQPSKNYANAPNKFKDDMMRKQYNFFDQILVRPDLIDNFVSVKVMEIPLVNRKPVSDHNPIYFVFENLVTRNDVLLSK